MVYGYSSGEVRKDRATVFIDREKEVASWVQGESLYVLSVGEWEGM